MTDTRDCYIVSQNDETDSENAKPKQTNDILNAKDQIKPKSNAVQSAKKNPNPLKACYTSKVSEATALRDGIKSVKNRGSPEEHLDELQQSCENWAAKTSRPEQRQVQQQTRMGKHLSSVIQQLVGCLKVLSGTGGSSTSPAENNGGNKIRLKKKYRGVKTVLNLSNKTLSNADWKGLKYCQKPKNHNNIQLKQDAYEFTRKLRPQEYFAAKAIDENDDEPDTHDNH